MKEMNKKPKGKYVARVLSNQGGEVFYFDERPNAYKLFRKLQDGRKSLRITISESYFHEETGYWLWNELEEISLANIRSYPEYKAEMYAPQSKYHKEVLDKRIAFYLSVRLYSDQDADIVKYFKENPEKDKSSIVKQALREYINK